MWWSHGEAAEDFAECIVWGEQKQLPSIIFYGLAGVAMTLAAADRHEQAVELFAHNTTLAGNLYARDFAQPGLMHAADHLPADVHEAAVERGEALELEQAKALALGLSRELGT